jgi:glyoxylase-like metal-dependent hydrolase (beta-lactamase superfamily II)
MSHAGLSPVEALEYAERAGISRLQIPTPFAVGRVNCYLIEDEPLTLIDAGPNSGKSLDELQRQLDAAGHAVEDLGLIVISHQHIDHLGLVDIIVSHSGAEVVAIDKLAHFAEHYGEDAARDDQFAGGVMLRNGIPEEIVRALQTVSSAFRAWGAKAKVTHPVCDGEILELRDRKLEVLHRPGHSPSDTVFWDSERRILIAADHLIKHISSNPLISRPLDDRDEGDPTKRPQALVTYLDSLRKTRDMPAEIVLSGHGDPITDHVALIDERFEFHRRRADKIYDLIAERPRTGYDLTQALFGDIAVTQAYLTLSEVLGHVDLLLNDGRVREEERDGVVWFSAT